MGLKTEEGEFNILAQLLSDNSHFPLRVSIFDGETKGSNLFSVREFGNDCLLYSLDELLRYGDVLNLIQTDETDRVVERKEVPLFDNTAFREAIINAVLHNKWVEGNEPMISAFSDRIEILSRGTLAPAQTMEGFFLGESIPVIEGNGTSPSAEARELLRATYLRALRDAYSEMQAGRHSRLSQIMQHISVVDQGVDEYEEGNDIHNLSIAGIADLSNTLLAKHPALDSINKEMTTILQEKML